MELTMTNIGGSNGSELITRAEFNAALSMMNDDFKNAISKIKHDTDTNTTTIRKIEEDYPLLPAEASKLRMAVSKKMVQVMGGKKSPAYMNLKTLRRAISKDIHREYKRHYGLIDPVTGREMRYDNLKRKYLEGALLKVENYELPIDYQNQVDAENELGFDEDYD